MNIDVPDVVRRKADAVGAGHWVAGLPQLIDGLERDWAIRVGAPFDGATEAYVAAATTADGEPAVLKLTVPRDRYGAAHEITALRLADGRGCVRLLRADQRRGALLLERLGAPMSQREMPVHERIDILCDLASDFWQRPGSDVELPTGVDKADWLVEFIQRTWPALGRPCAARTVAHALDCANRRREAHSSERARVLHGDVHQWNALARDDGWALIDPDGLLAEPEYDLGVLMREDPVELLRDGPRERARHLADRTGLTAAAIWEWGVVERVSTGLLAVSIGLEPVGSEMLAAADELAGVDLD